MNTDTSDHFEYSRNLPTRCLLIGENRLFCTIIGYFLSNLSNFPRLSLLF